MIFSPRQRPLAALVERLGSPEALCQLVELLPVGILLVDGGGVVEFANPAARAVLEMDDVGRGSRFLNDLMDSGLRELLAGQDGAEAAPLCWVSEKVSRRELCGLTAAGAERVVAVAVLGKVDGRSLCTLDDITCKKQLELELARQETFFHNLISSSVDGIIAADMRGRIILFNQGAEEILGYTREEALQSLHVSRLYPEGEARQILARLRSDEYGGRGKLLRHELVAITKDGRQVPMSLSGGILYDQGKEVATFGIFTDLRAMQKIAQDLQQTHQMLVQSERMAGLGRLAAGVAHEINNPMSGIMLYSNLVKEQLGEDHPAAPDLEIIVHEAERCKQIVADLLEFSHQTGYGEQGVDVNQQIEKSLDVLKVQPLFHNIEVVLDLEQGLSRIWGNPIRLSQVFVNIIVNAAQAMEGTGRLTIASRHRANQGIVEVRISDTGPGIDKEIQAQIFDPFFTTKTSQGGTGLGLSVSYALVKEHKGSIRVESEPGEGATFIMRFPVLQQSPAGDKP